MKRIRNIAFAGLALSPACGMDSDVDALDAELGARDGFSGLPGTLIIEPDVDAGSDAEPPFVLAEPEELRTQPSDSDSDSDAEDEPNPNMIASLEFATGYVQFIDRAAALQQPGGGVAVVATGALAAPVARLLEDEKATALELFLLLSGEQDTVPERLFQDHDESSATVDSIPTVPRSFFAPDLVAAIVIDPEDGQCPAGSSFNFFKGNWKFWSSSYGNQISCADTNANFNITTWNSSSRALGACYSSNTCGSAGANISFWSWTGSAWSFISSHSFGTNPAIGQAIYFGVSGEGVGQNQGRVTGVTSGCERVFAGVRSQISGGSDQC